MKNYKALNELILIFVCFVSLVHCQHFFNRHSHPSQNEDRSNQNANGHFQNVHRNNNYEKNYKSMDMKSSGRSSEINSMHKNNFQIDSLEPKRTNKMRVCEEKHLEYMKSLFDDFPHENVEDFNGRELAEPGEYPHMAAIGFPTSNKNIDYKCGGSLISENFVITAAHCTDNNGVKPIKVKIGDLNLKVREANVEPQKRNIERIYSHPDYNEVSHFNDIGLLELESNFLFTKFVYPIRLWVSNKISHKTAYAMGYGATEFLQQQTYTLTDMNLTIISNDECNKKLPSNNDNQTTIVSSQICAYDFEMNRDTCQGDSGGPLQLNLWSNSEHNYKRYFLIGITSYGVFCRSQYPGVYTRVSSYIDWIENIVWN